MSFYLLSFAHEVQLALSRAGMSGPTTLPERFAGVKTPVRASRAGALAIAPGMVRVCETVLLEVSDSSM